MLQEKSLVRALAGSGAAVDFSGTWKNELGSIATITQAGNVLSGEYESAEATLPISSDISLTATLDILRAISEGRGPREALFALGYAGWGPGQIESEIQANGWIHCDADAGVIFGAAMDSKWSTALRKLGISVSALSAHSGHA